MIAEAGFNSVMKKRKLDQFVANIVDGSLSVSDDQLHGIEGILDLQDPATN